jgi:hypothetical protein
MLLKGEGYLHKKLPTLAIEWTTKGYWYSTSATILAIFTHKLSIAMIRLHLAEASLFLVRLCFSGVLGVATSHHLFLSAQNAPLKPFSTLPPSFSYYTIGQPQIIRTRH